MDDARGFVRRGPMTHIAAMNPLVRTPTALAIALLLAACAAGVESADRERYDIVITGGTLFDGTGAEPVPADVAIRGDRIVRLSRSALDGALADRVIDAAGLYVAPGFIDVHAHLDPILRLPAAESHVRQGVTTALGGPDGSSPWPLVEHLDSLDRVGTGMNVGFMVGHNTVRRQVLGLDDRLATPDELSEMERLVARGMGDGAFGISTGLKYLPGAFADLDEVVALSRVAADSGGFYTSHMREEGLGLIEAVAELLEIGRRAELPVVVTHHKVVGAPMWGSSRTTLAMIDSARAAGTDARLDQYPYTATYTGISVLVPAWARAGGQDAFEERLQDPALRDSIMDGIVFNIVNDRGAGDIDRVQLARVPWDRSLEGGSLADWAVREGLEPTPEVGAELVVEAMRRGNVSAIYHALEEEDVRRIMRHPQTMIASDGRLTEPGDGHPHPRWYGTFPRVLGHYVRDEGVLSWADAVRKMTSLPADLMGLADRGELREGAFADIVIFDPATIVDRATFQAPHQYPAGIPYVIVNGVVTVDGGEYLDVRPGRTLRRGDGGGAP